MFSAEDAKQVFQLLSSEDELSNPLILSSHGDGFVTRKYIRQAFEDIVTKANREGYDERVSITYLARDLNVSTEIVRSLADECDGAVILRSSNGREVITKTQRDAIYQDLQEGIMFGLISRDEFTRENDLSHSSFDLLINASEVQIVEVDGYLCSTSYETTASKAIANYLRKQLQELKSLNLRSSDIPGDPPTLFVRRMLDSLVKDPEFEGAFHIQELPNGVRCTPVQLMRQVHDAVIENLKSGKTAYIDLNAFQRDNQATYSSIDEARAFLEGTEGVELVDTFALSDAWMSKFSRDCVSSMARDGDVDFGQPVIASFPDSIYAIVLEKVEHMIRSLSPSVHRAGESLLSEDSYSRHRGILLDLAKADASSQWHRLEEDPRTDTKYLLSNTFYQILEDNPVLQNLVKERTLERAIDDAFSARISELEKQNETQFADFWTDRVVTRVTIYSEGLDTVEDQKLQDQLSDLLAHHIHTDLVPDAVSKATSQGLILSRKTRKNVQRLESALKSGNTAVTALTASLDKFNKKQSIDAPESSILESSKATMLGDMARRMQKQRKSDGPLLFLTLIVFLFAKHYAGIVYATGKFAPKLLKQLKAVLDVEQYAQLEAWKEAARSSSLSAEDRDGMKRMVEAGV
ncbi:hypothetical protein SVAN01_05570 [Stagonosporopsis vannaccii]|nr:hypothetical protein SVAN01_05570 [Stagonosporopsis vannaccii]